jgi:hypothetical protein
MRSLLLEGSSSKRDRLLIVGELVAELIAASVSESIASTGMAQTE